MTSVTEQYSEEMLQSYGIKLISVNSKIHFQICKCEIIDARMNHIKSDVEMLLAKLFPTTYYFRTEKKTITEGFYQYLPNIYI